MNPILQTLQRVNDAQNIVRQLKSSDPNVLFSQMMKTNPEFQKFVEENKNKSPEEIASEYNIDLNQFRNMFCK